MDGASGNNVESHGRFRKSPRALGSRRLPGENPSSSLTVASNVQIPFICAKAGLAIAVCGKTVCDRLKTQRSQKHHQLKHMGVGVCALPSVRHCDLALQHDGFCPSSALRASWKSEGQPRTWVFDVWWWPAHVDVGLRRALQHHGSFSNCLLLGLQPFI